MSKQLPLEFLTQEDVRGYAEHHYPGAALSAEQIAIIHDKTYGNPLFVENFFTHLCSVEVLRATPNGWQLQGDLADIGMPDNLRVLIDQQLQLLDLADQELLKKMSIAGVRVGIAAAAAATGLSLEYIEERCEQLAEQRFFIDFAGVEDMPDGSIGVFYQFHHALYQEVLYRHLPEPRRMRAHLAVGRCLEAQLAEQAHEQAVILAIHFSQGRDYQKAAYYWHLAAEQAVRRYAYAKALEYIQNGLELLPRIRDLSQRRQRELALQMTLGPVLIASVGNTADSVEQAYLRAQELCQRLGETERSFPVLFGLRSYYQFRGQLQTAHAYAQKLLAVAQQTGSEDFLLESYVALASTHYFLGELAASCDYARRARNYTISNGIVSMSPCTAPIREYSAVRAMRRPPGSSAIRIGRCGRLSKPCTWLAGWAIPTV
ncbi:MAG: hypothetical protein R3F37_23160 [Candidatus Competibacteraceae bacterium]